MHAKCVHTTPVINERKPSLQILKIMNRFIKIATLALNLSIPSLYPAFHDVYQEYASGKNQSFYFV